jgi:hypothetical protein
VQSAEFATQERLWPAEQLAAAWAQVPTVETTPLVHVEVAEPSVGAVVSLTDPDVPLEPPL